MIGDAPEALGDEESGPFLGRLARQGIDDAGLPRTAVEEDELSCAAGDDPVGALGI